MLARLKCKLRGHDPIACTQTVYPESELMEHLHYCVRCGAITLTDLTLIPLEVQQEVVEALGIPLINFEDAVKQLVAKKTPKILVNDDGHLH